jgi:hypothetical protein
MSLPRVSAEAIFEISREIATAKPPSEIMDCSIARKASRGAVRRFRDSWPKRGLRSLDVGIREVQTDA